MNTFEGKNMVQEKSLYEELGGKEGIDAMCDLLLIKCEGNEKIKRFFVGVDHKEQVDKIGRFWTGAFGGKSDYKESLYDTHQKLRDVGMNDEHFDVVMEMFGETANDLKVPEHLAEEAGVIAEGYRDVILGRRKDKFNGIVE